MTALLNQFELAKRNLDENTEQLTIIADWRDDLRARIARARLRHELAGLSPEEIIGLADEARDFRRVCLALRGVFDV